MLCTVRTKYFNCRLFASNLCILTVPSAAFHLQTCILSPPFQVFLPPAFYAADPNVIRKHHSPRRLLSDPFLLSYLPTRQTRRGSGLIFDAVPLLPEISLLPLYCTPHSRHDKEKTYASSSAFPKKSYLAQGYWCKSKKLRETVIKLSVFIYFKCAHSCMNTENLEVEFWQIFDFIHPAATGKGVFALLGSKFDYNYPVSFSISYQNWDAIFKLFCNSTRFPLQQSKHSQSPPSPFFESIIRPSTKWNMK